jgi:DNA-binding XRE family transcriptional regulator
MVKSLKDKLNAISETRKVSIEMRASELIAEEMTLRDLRIALEKTQQELGAALHIKQDGISRLENRSDMLLSTLNKYIGAMGGTLKLIAEFPGRPSIVIHGVSDIHTH